MAMFKSMNLSPKLFSNSKISNLFTTPPETELPGSRDLLATLRLRDFQNFRSRKVKRWFLIDCELECAINKNVRFRDIAVHSNTCV